jgi:MFS family permease
MTEVHTNKAVRFKLFLMMVLELAVWGAWFEMVFGYLGGSGLNLTPSQQSWILSMFPLAAIAGMFFSNQFADRSFAAEKFMAASHLIGGLAMAGLAYTTSFVPMLIFMAVHCFFYVPTLSIANGIAFAAMKNPAQEFGIIRMGGTVGWILAATPLVFLLADWGKIQPLSESGFVTWIGQVFGTTLKGPALVHATAWTFKVSAIVSIILAAFSLTLPHTPPKPLAPGESPYAWLVAFKLLAKPFVLILWIVTFIDAALLQMYFSWTGRFLDAIGIPANFQALTMKIGQVAEVLTMIVLGMVLKRLGWKWTMVLGILGHTIRFTVFAFFPQEPPVIASILLHGVCYAFFFATVYIFVDAVFPKDVRSSAQGLFNVMILGLGPLVVNMIAPWLFDEVFTHDKITDYKGLFLLATGISLFAALLLGLGFHPPKDVGTDVETGH